ncbi:MAG: DNA polymerase III, epsilon subunit [Candidatus Xenolissoclinum pacificiensis L6]|uniref:DNA polymerase III subunit epsilon n=1 Tax=Candidatus Xenolissoclinum pacificiensis L6 TaxID=1401685 RepID=W2V0G9_9RICK|nr:MAG: DNA polymerase III, epsilon subunit [Candidatus Xenolissoclinum pacificiensis L6]
MVLIALDTETTGLSPQNGDRIIEIACVHIVEDVLSDQFEYFHTLVNPERHIPYQATAIHGIKDKDVMNQPKFIDIVDEFLFYIKDATLVIHNAQFDLKFLNFELSKIGEKNIENNIIDSLSVARNLFPGTSNSLDALCNKFKISLEQRKKHNALIDTKLLAQVYLQLNTCSQKTMRLDNTTIIKNRTNKILPARPIPSLSREEEDCHTKFLHDILQVDSW